MSNALYSQVRPNIRSGDMIMQRVTTMSSFLDFLLILYQKFFKSKFSHVGVALVYGGRVFCLEATPPVVRLIPLSMIGDFSIVHTNLEWSEPSDGCALKYIGRDYSLTDFMRGILHLSTSPKELYCSELLARIYKDLGLVQDLEDGSRPDKIIEKVISVLKERGMNPEIIEVSIDRGNF